MSTQTHSALAPVSFDFNSFSVRAFLIDNDPWLIASDVAKVLGYRDAEKMTRMLDDDEKDTHIMGTPGGQQSFTVINESGTYTCILRSRRQNAKPFRKWVTAEVLPSLRKTGSYTMKTLAIESPTITPGEQQTLSEIVAKRSAECADIGKARQEIWSRLHRKFRVAKYNQLPREQLADAIAYVMQMEIKSPALAEMPAPERTAPTDNPNYAYAREQMSSLYDWGRRALPPSVHAEFQHVMQELDRSLIRGWTEIDEAVMHMAVSMSMLKRYKRTH